VGINLQNGQRIDIGPSKVGERFGWSAKRGGDDGDASAFMLNSQMHNSFIRIFDDVTHLEICKYELGNGKWHFEASGAGHHGGLETLVEKYA
jgi:stress response protein SCP2